MPLKKASGNMYDFITHTWNPVRGKCQYDCSYCYVKRWGEQSHIHLDKGEMKVDLGEGNYIFVCSGCDLFASDVPSDWIYSVMERTRFFPKNLYLWHTKNPARVLNYHFSNRDMLCVTIESNREYPRYSKAPQPWARFKALEEWKHPYKLTIEPVMTFDADVFLGRMSVAGFPVQVNIGADSGRNNLPEPSREELIKLINGLARRTKVHLKKNLRRLLPEHELYGGECG